MRSVRDPHHRRSGGAVTGFVLVALGAVPVLLIGYLGFTLGAWVGFGLHWYGPLLIVIGLAMSIGAGIYSLRLGAIWGAILVASPALCVALVFVVGAAQPLLGVLFSPVLILIGLALTLTTDHRLAAEAMAGQEPADGTQTTA